jgi:hypothetical protein
MSVVTDIIVTYSGLDDDKLDTINAWMVTQREYEGDRFVAVDEKAGGGKAMQANVALGAFNYFELDEFLVFLDTIEWERPEAVKVFVQEEHDEDGFTLRYGPGTRKAKRP